MTEIAGFAPGAAALGPVGRAPFLEEVERATDGVEGGGLTGSNLADDDNPEDGALDQAAAVGEGEKRGP